MVLEVIPEVSNGALNSDVLNAEKSKVLSARAPGRVERIYAFDGAEVNVGSPVVELYSPEFISAQQEYLLSSKTAHVLESSKTMSDLLGDARITQQAAANRMRNLGAGDGVLLDLLEQVLAGLAGDE